MNAIKKITVLLVALTMAGCIFISFKDAGTETPYALNYREKLLVFQNQQQELFQLIKETDLSSERNKALIRSKIKNARKSLKSIDLWLRYLEPTAYKKINGPLRVEWETEVFEKFEKPYKREGAGLTLAELYLDEEQTKAVELQRLIAESLQATNVYIADSITGELKTADPFFFCNRLFILNLAAIYTSGFECPDTSAVVPELRSMLNDVYAIYLSFNSTFPETPLDENYLSLFNKAIQFVGEQPQNYSQFDHFTFIRQFVNPLFSINQGFIRKYRMRTKSNADYSLTKSSTSIFSKSLYNGQNPKGIFLRVTDEQVLAELDKVGKLLFYDPILSGNNKRSCASCHQTDCYFTDTANSTAFQFNQKDKLERNAPSLIGAPYNHLLMLDGKHISMKDQAIAVLTNSREMGADEATVLKNVLSCKDYKRTFKSLLNYTPQEKEITLEHITSALSFYYSKFSRYDAPFDEAMNNNKAIDNDAKRGFNLFMSKAQCGTCHFLPQFNGVKPPYIASEFEILGVPEDTSYTRISDDTGRFGINAAEETMHAFRTGTVRNAEKTKPYMHNGVFTNLEQVIDFYDAGGGAGHGLKVSNQTLSSDSLHLTNAEKKELIAFIRSLNENIQFERPPDELPASSISALNQRRVGGTY